MLGNNLHIMPNAECCQLHLQLTLNKSQLLLCLFVAVAANVPTEKVLLTSLGEAQKELDNFRAYRSKAKPPRLDQKARLETCFNTLQTRLRLNGRPPFLPTEGHLISDINSAWKVTIPTATFTRSSHLKIQLLFFAFKVSKFVISCIFSSL
jgi:hypothetical protein